MMKNSDVMLQMSIRSLKLVCKTLKGLKGAGRDERSGVGAFQAVIEPHGHEFG